MVKKYKHLITALIGVLMLVVLAISYFNGGNVHGDYDEWATGGHAVQANIRSGDLERFCLKCHAEKRNETIEETERNYCMACHTGQNVDTLGAR